MSDKVGMQSPCRQNCEKQNKNEQGEEKYVMQNFSEITSRMYESANKTNLNNPSLISHNLLRKQNNTKKN